MLFPKMAFVFCKDVPKFAGIHFSFGIFLVVTSPYLIKDDILVAARRGLAGVLKFQHVSRPASMQDDLYIVK